MGNNYDKYLGEFGKGTKTNVIVPKTKEEFILFIIKHECPSIKQENAEKITGLLIDLDFQIKKVIHNECPEIIAEKKIPEGEVICQRRGFIKRLTHALSAVLLYQKDQYLREFKPKKKRARHKNTKQRKK